MFTWFRRPCAWQDLAFYKCVVEFVTTGKRMRSPTVEEGRFEGITSVLLSLVGAELSVWAAIWKLVSKCDLIADNCDYVFPGCRQIVGVGRWLWGGFGFAPPSGPTLTKLQGTNTVMMQPFIPSSWPAGLLLGLAGAGGGGILFRWGGESWFSAKVWKD